MSAAILRSSHFGTILRAPLTFKDRENKRKCDPFCAIDRHSDCLLIKDVISYYLFI